MIKKLFYFFCKKDLTFTCKRVYNNDMMRSVFIKKKKIDPSKYKKKRRDKACNPFIYAGLVIFYLYYRIVWFPYKET